LFVSTGLLGHSSLDFVSLFFNRESARLQIPPLPSRVPSPRRLVGLVGVEAVLLLPAAGVVLVVVVPRPRPVCRGPESGVLVLVVFGLCLGLLRLGRFFLLRLRSRFPVVLARVLGGSSPGVALALDDSVVPLAVELEELPDVFPGECLIGFSPPRLLLLVFLPGSGTELRVSCLRQVRCWSWNGGGRGRCWNVGGSAWFGGSQM
jgi:hypothetical protein